MNEYIAFDSHRKYTLAERDPVEGGRPVQQRIDHRPGAIREYLADAALGGTVAVEATGNWYWIVSEIEQAGMRPVLIHPGKAKLMMGMIDKTDKLDVHGFNRLQRVGTLPSVWIPPAGLRDQRELTRTRMVLSRQRTRLKNRLSSTLAKYNLTIPEYSDIFGVGARRLWPGLVRQLPTHTRFSVEQLLEELDGVVERIARFEARLAGVVQATKAMRLQQTLPGFGPILSPVVTLEIGQVRRFPDAAHLASYCGTTPRVHSSGGKTWHGRLRQNVNRYLKWAFVEAANVTAQSHRRYPDRHVSRLYVRLKAKRGHAKAIGAIARHLSEATWHVQSRDEPYRDPNLGRTRKA